MEQALHDMTDEELLLEFGLRLHTVRRKRKLGLNTVALATGIGASTLSRYETGNVQPGLTNVVRLAAYYDVTMEWLAGDLWSTRVLPNGEVPRWDLIIGGRRGESPGQRSLPFLTEANES